MLEKTNLTGSPEIAGNFASRLSVVPALQAAVNCFDRALMTVALSYEGTTNSQQVWSCETDWGERRCAKAGIAWCSIAAGIASAVTGSTACIRVGCGREPARAPQMRI